MNEPLAISCASPAVSEVWTKEETTTLIDALKEFPCLYNVKSGDYKNRSLRDDAMKQIWEKVKCLNERMTMEDIRKKINTLKGQFRKEIRALTLSKKSGCGEDVYTPKLWCFNLLFFLKDNAEVRDSSSSLDVLVSSFNYD